jgi:hypothetical protein
MKHNRLYATALTIAALCGACESSANPTDEANMTQTAPADAAAPRVEEKIVVGQIWPAVKVGFCLLTHEDRQYIAYYNADRRTVVATRKLGEERFTEFVLPSKSDEPPARTGPASTIQGWDSHNYLTMAVDDDGNLHLSGNMHASALNYFRTEKPGDITTLTQFESMVGQREARTTYPKFMKAPDGTLLFHYRDGGSGNGDEIYNAYDIKTRKWTRFLDAPLISGDGKCNAYQIGPMKGPDGWYHLLWMWRATPAVETNHNLSYARTRDLKNWETAAGEPLKLPITPDTTQTLVDPVPQNGGLHNSVHRMGFDSRGRVVVSYYKHDANGDTQAYAARFEDGKWKIQQISNWKGQHVFRGGGSGPSTFGTSIALGTVEPFGAGRLALSYRHWTEGAGLIVIDENTLAPVSLAENPPAKSQWPADLARVTSDFPGMSVNWRGSLGGPTDPNNYYLLRWETLGPNRDRPRTGDLPEKGDLVLYKITTSR